MRNAKKLLADDTLPKAGDGSNEGTSVGVVNKRDPYKTRESKPIEVQIAGEPVTIIKVGSILCKRHPWFKALRKPRNPCEICEAAYAHNRLKGVKETRSSRKEALLKAKIQKEIA